MIKRYKKWVLTEVDCVVEDDESFEELMNTESEVIKVEYEEVR